MTFPVECQYHAPLEPHWAWEDDDSWAWDERVLSRRWVTARKQHKCNRYGCRLPIMPGQRYMREFRLIDGAPSFIKHHAGGGCGNG